MKKGLIKKNKISIYNSILNRNYFENYLCSFYFIYFDNNNNISYSKILNKLIFYKQYNNYKEYY